MYVMMGRGGAEVMAGWLFGGGRVVWVVKSGEWSRFGRRAVTGWVGGVVETFAICSELSNGNTCSWKRT
jgi:hypothetical protein